jgi:hypothetical protein
MQGARSPGSGLQVDKLQPKDTVQEENAAGDLLISILSFPS